MLSCVPFPAVLEAHGGHVVTCYMSKRLLISHLAYQWSVCCSELQVQAAFFQSRLGELHKTDHCRRSIDLTNQVCHRVKRHHLAIDLYYFRL